MAAISAAVASPSSAPHHPPLSRRRRSLRSLRCHVSPPENEPRAPQLLKLAVSGATELLRLLYPTSNNNPSDREELRNEGGVLAHNVDDVVRILRLDYENAYFLTGKFTADIYADDCLFEDPTLRFRGKERYSQNLDLLVPFFDRPSLELEQIEKGLDSGMNFVLAKWKLRTYLKFPWRPLISIREQLLTSWTKNSRLLGMWRAGMSLHLKQLVKYLLRVLKTASRVFLVASWYLKNLFSGC